MSWRSEHPEANVPQYIDRLVKVGLMIDQSWHNDVCPSFHGRVREGVDPDNDPDNGFTLWVDYEKEEDRESWNAEFRFRIFTNPWDNEGQYVSLDGEEKTVLLTNDMERVAVWVRQNAQLL